MARPPTLETGRLLLRPFTEHDVDALAAMFDDLEAMWDVVTIPGMPAEPRAIAAKRIADSTNGWADHDAGFWAVAVRARALGPPGRIIGYCGFTNAAKAEADGGSGAALEVGWGMHPSFQRRGLAREAMAAVLDYAFGPRRCARLIAITDPRNLASRGLATGLGFTFEREIQAYGAVQVRYVLDRDAYLARCAATD